MKTITIELLALGFISVGLPTIACAGNGKPETSGQHLNMDISLPSAQSTCGSKSPLIGKTFALTTRHHGVEGDVTIIDDCTLEINNFNYDGKGLQVEIYSSMDGSFEKGQALSIDLLRPEKPYKDERLVLRLPASLMVDSIEGISVWCIDASVSFGDVLFSVESSETAE